MVMIQEDFDNWNERINVKKGNIGEQIVFDYLYNIGYVIYRPVTGGAHPFDNLCVSRDKKDIFIAEVKTKEARQYYPDTGINIKNYNEYKFIQNKYNLHVFLFFVDADNLKVYGNFIACLEAKKVSGKCSYPLKQNGIIYFPLSNMKLISELTDDQAKAIKEHNTKRYNGAWEFNERR
jgi:hypothetical protein